ncbi:MAG: DNA cytosine methyltransferase [Christensenellales bacterium]
MTKLKLNANTTIKKSPNITRNVLSLFSGCGGMDLGFEGDFLTLANSVNQKINNHWEIKNINEKWIKLPKTSFNTIFANDIRPDAQAAWINFFKTRGIDRSTYKLKSIVDLVKAHKDGEKIFPGNVDVVTGGFPCQDFSIAGKRQGFNSTKCHMGDKRETQDPSEENRGQLYMWMREVISIVQPKVFYAENVKGLTTLSDAKAVIEEDFSTICEGGYLVVPARVLLAANYGVPQGRERVIFIGFKKSALKERALKELSAEKISSEYDPYPLTTHEKKENGAIKQFVTAIEVLDDLLEPYETNEIEQQSYSKAKFLPRGQGNTEINLNGLAPTIRAEHHGNIEFRRLSSEHGGRNEEELKKGLPERRLTIRECARIQTFPDDYQFIIPAQNGFKSVSASSAYKLIGNAVPPLMGFHLAKRLEDNWDKYFY